jgi:hypothetical protein
MSTATWLSLVNQVQVKLREPTTASVTTNDYSTLIGALVNQAKREIEDMHDWYCLRQNLSVSCSSGTAEYSVTGMTQRSRLYTRDGSIWNQTNPGVIYPAPRWYLDYVQYVGTSVSGLPIYYTVIGVDSSGYQKIRVYPTPDQSMTLQLPCVVPQDDLTSDGDYLTLPPAAVVMRAYSLALAERGEDGGTTSNQAASDAVLALDQAIRTDTGNMADEELIWQVV